jgi:Family of unknown function (DUF6152)
MKTKPAALLAALIALLAVSVPVFAHHGSASYEMTKSVSVKGAVTNFQFVNPHVLIFIESKNNKGEGEKWQGELTSPNRLNRAGWKHDTLKPGDVITLIGAPAKSGAHSLWITKILGTDGQPMNLTMGD